MRILHVNKFLYRRGGAEAYMLDVAGLQAKAGHEIEYFSMAHPMNLPSRFESHFPEELELNPPPSSLGGKVRGAGRVLYSPASRRGMAAVLEAFRPDVVHLHNIYHQLSPSILRPLKDQGIPAVMTLHDYKLACPTYLFLDHGQVCEACLGGHFYNAVLRRCNDGSLLASSLSAIELTLHTATRAYSPVRVFLCPSRFLLSKMTEAGVYPDRLRLLPNFVDVHRIKPGTEQGTRVLYAGRLSPEKGVDVLIEAAALAGIELDIAGDGPARAEFEALAQRLGASVRWHGHMSQEALHDLTRTAAVAVMPSRCHENQPLGVLEAFACGVPVVGTTLGGIPDLIRPGTDGDLAPPNDPPGLAEALQRVLADPRRAREMGRAARAKVEEEFSPETHLERLEQRYLEAAA
ncbi:MAG: glycosyltransferase family 4 protein [Actinobacteria bacterium]|nr:glycosyltransferase family 4 protein [Actinomycetota bacterium]